MNSVGVTQTYRTRLGTQQPKVDRPTKPKLECVSLEGANVILAVGADYQRDRQSCFRSMTRLSTLIYSASE
jgi:hypothetical protein